MKKIVLGVLICLFAVSCSNETENQVFNNEEMAPVKVHVGGFDVTQGEISEAREMTRAAEAVENYEGVKALTLAFYKSDGTEQYQVTQFRSNMSGQTFGEFSLALPMGSYTMVVVGRGYSDGDVFALTSPTLAEYTNGRVRETFVATEAVNVTTNTPLDLSATLNRVVAKVQINSTDLKTADVSKMRITFAAGGKAVNPTTGLATVNTGVVNELTGSGSVGNTTTAITYLFLATDEQTMDITIETLDADGKVLFTKVVNNVPLKRNRLTKLTGMVYTADAGSTSFLINSDWEPENNVGF